MAEELKTNNMPYSSSTQKKYGENPLKKKKQGFGAPFKMKLTGGVHFTQPSKAVYRGAFHSPANEGMNYQDYIRTHRGVRK